MRSKILFLVISCGPQCVFWAEAESETSRKTLQAPAEIQGYPCAKGYAWFYSNGSLRQCAVSRDTAFGEAQVPAGSIVVLLPDGKPRYVMLSHDATILGYHCRGGGPLGPAEGDATGFYPSGKLKLCWFVDDQEAQGVPCMAAGSFFDAIFHHDNVGTNFYESGRLHSCTLSKDFKGLRRGERYVQAP